jgi:hypothetical protein
MGDVLDERFTFEGQVARRAFRRTQKALLDRRGGGEPVEEPRARVRWLRRIRPRSSRQIGRAA